MKNRKNTNKKNVKKNGNKIIKIKTKFDSKNLVHTTKLKVLAILTILIFILLIVRIGFLQFVQGNFLK